MRGELADSLKENDYFEENFIYKEIIQAFFGKNKSTICGQEDLAKFTYQDLLQFYQQTITLNNLTLINHGDLGS